VNHHPDKTLGEDLAHVYSRSRKCSSLGHIFFKCAGDAFRKHLPFSSKKTGHHLKNNAVAYTRGATGRRAHTSGPAAFCRALPLLLVGTQGAVLGNGLALLASRALLSALSRGLLWALTPAVACNVGASRECAAYLASWMLPAEHMRWRFSSCSAPM
jgi:hypothetical protein